MAGSGSIRWGKKVASNVEYLREQLLKQIEVTRMTSQRIIGGVANYAYEGDVYPYILIYKNGDAEKIETFEGYQVLSEYCVISCRSNEYADADKLGTTVKELLKLFGKVMSVRELQDASNLVDEEVLFQRQFMLEVSC